MTVQTTQQEVTVTGEAPVVDTEKTEVSQVVSAVGGEQPAHRRPALGQLRAAHAQRHHRRHQRAGLLPRHLRPLQQQHGGRRQQQPGVLFRRRAAAPTAAPTSTAWIPSQEYQVSTSNYSAELGQAAGGVVNAVTKSGTNDHPRRPVLLPALPHLERARSLSQIARAITPSPSINGSSSAAASAAPIIKDKLFYFVTYDGSRKVNPISLHQQHLQLRRRHRAALSGAGDAHAVRRRQCVPVRPAGHVPARHQPGRGFRQAGLRSSTPRNHVSASFDFMNYRAPNAYSTSPSLQQQLA